MSLDRKYVPAWIVAILIIASAVTVAVRDGWKHLNGESAYSTPGAELDLTDLTPYGWSGSKSAGTRFTDGLNYLWISSNATSSIKIVSVTPLIDNRQTLKVVGILARVIPDMLPRGHKTGWFQQDKGFPPSSYDNTGGRDPCGLIVRKPQPGEKNLGVEFQVGFDVTGNGKSSKTGVEVIYEYKGKMKRVIIPSHLSICVPATIKCSPKGE